MNDDYPHTLPLDLPFVSMTLENSRHYTLSSPTSDADFQSIYPSSSLGFVRLGPKKRFFGLSMYHQIHCLDALRLAIQGKNPHGEHNLGSSGKEHWKEDHSDHCLNYLRQTILCNADLTLEEEFPEEGSSDVGEGLGAKYVCKDWSLVYVYVERNFEEWQEWRNGTRTSHHY
ncbi:uncharacterized protein STEHIDRAFT_96132 [Stereum hirsutum FP-91666 SS1]|uniref:uncharacterized protein n=1 Tax=Stereum hirsutum (strain FP-91666) TaxID=721885 RepID=UPI000440FA64|nr:uncharacterized protein STEHIDRAFT_96132 [Stereum hirsutum FP-91666 SS1]EIM87135.1 hypothetical protein STEHIDRAFT_96132 [Stereum hirsutum FP-91666 SS1]